VFAGGRSGTFDTCLNIIHMPAMLRIIQTMPMMLAVPAILRLQFVGVVHSLCYQDYSEHDADGERNNYLEPKAYTERSQCPQTQRYGRCCRLFYRSDRSSRSLSRRRQFRSYFIYPNSGGGGGISLAAKEAAVGFATNFRTRNKKTKLSAHRR
jgi:hypothetical protein